jgi:hypothetical protein
MAKYTSLPTYMLTALAGAAIALGNMVEICGDDCAKTILALWFMASGAIGILAPERPWRWACTLGLSFVICGLSFHALRYGSLEDSQVLLTFLILWPLSTAVSLIGGYAGSCLRYVAKPE